MVNAQEWLDNFYPKEKRKNITELYIGYEDLEGHLDLKDFTNLKELDCYNNKLTSIDLKGLNQLETISCFNNYLTNFDYSVLNLDKLTFLNITDNNLSEQNLSVFSNFTNLELLWIGGENKNHFSQNIYNKFYGSLETLQNLTKLKNLHIANTDINSGWEYLPNSIETIYYSSKARPESKVKEISEQLNCFPEWAKRGFNGQQLKEWIEAGLTLNDHYLVI